MTDRLEDLDVVTVNHRSGSAVARLADDLNLEGRLIVADNSSEQGDLFDAIGTRSDVKVVSTGGNIGFGAAANEGFRSTGRPYVAFCNPDANPTRDDLAKLVNFLATHPRYAACGPALTDDRGDLVVGVGGWQPSLPRVIAQAVGLYLVLPRSGIALKPRRGVTYDVGWIAGTCFVVRREAFQEVGGFDPSYFLYQEDVDLGRRLTAGGWRLAVTAHVRVPHVEGTSSSEVDRRWLISVRASALRRYLDRTLPRTQARIARTVLALGYLGRAAVHALAGRWSRASEMLRYARALRLPHPQDRTR